MKKLAACVVIGVVLTACGAQMVGTAGTVATMEAQSAQTAKANGDVAKDVTDKTAIQRAIDAYVAEKGSYPSSLDELVPDFLPYLPKKSDGSAFGYDSSTGKVLDSAAAAASSGEGGGAVAVPRMSLPTGRNEETGESQ